MKRVKWLNCLYSTEQSFVLPQPKQLEREFYLHFNLHTVILLKAFWEPISNRNEIILYN